MTNDCCPSDFSRQRAVVMTNTVPIMLDGIAAAIEALPVEPSLAEVERILVQMEQLAARLHCGPLSGEESRAFGDARAALLGGDPALAVGEMRDLLTGLRVQR